MRFEEKFRANGLRFLNISLLIIMLSWSQSLAHTEKNSKRVTGVVSYVSVKIVKCPIKTRYSLFILCKVVLKISTVEHHSL